jgi:hypothetical protein
MDSHLEKKIGQDQQDHGDKTAFGRKGSSPKAKKIFTSLNFEEQRSVFNQGRQSCKSCLKK